MSEASARAGSALAGAAAAAAGGVAWLALIPAAWLHRKGDLGYDAYYRIVAVPLVLFAVAFFVLGRRWRPRTDRGRLALWVTLGGLVLVAAGTFLEFWVVLLQDAPTAHQAAGSGERAFWGSDAGWFLFVLGLFALFVGGPTAAVAIARERAFPRRVQVLVALLGLGVILANVLREAPPAATIPLFGAFAGGWLALGVLLARRSEPARSAEGQTRV